MRRFIIRPDRVIIEGVQFSDGFIVIHGSVFHGVHISDITELRRMFGNEDIRWIDEDQSVTGDEEQAE